MTSRRRPSSPTRAVSLGAGSIVVVLAIALLGSALANRRSSAAHKRVESRAQADAWDKQAAKALGPLARSLPSLANDVGRWQRGEILGAELRPKLSAAKAVFAVAGSAIVDLPVSPAGHVVNRLYSQSVSLDQVWIDLMLAAVDLPVGPLTGQVALSAQRVRELGDRIFDRGRAPLALLLPPPAPTGVDVVRPADVPDWVAEGLAAGPPLDAVPPPASGQPSVRIEHRPEQSRVKWQAAVAAAHDPSVSDIEAALSARSGIGLQDLARRLVTAVDRLRDEPDPQRDREGADRVYLSLLVEAEAARIGQAATLLDTTAATADVLRAAASRVLAIAGAVVGNPVN